jgi:hypothetical protein
MSKISKIFVIILGVLIIIAATAVATYFIIKEYNPGNILGQNQYNGNSLPTEQTNSENQDQISGLTEQTTPPFLQNIKTNANVKMDFHYDGDYTPQRDYFANNYEYYVPAGSSEKYLVVSKAKNRQSFDYGLQDYLPIFKSQESHSYQGTPIYILNSTDKSSLSYIGLKMSDKTLISELRVELGIDYNAHYWTKANDEKKPFIAWLLGIGEAQACGAGTYLRKVGDSTLDFVQESDGILWYKLRNPIAIYNLRLEYADADCSTKPSYCQDQYDDPAECEKYWACFWNASIPDLTKGNLRMHLYYKPNDKEGLLKLQVANVILSDITGAFSQATMGEGFDHFYRAYFQ